MPDTIRDFVMQQPLFDAHEHVVTLPAFADLRPHYASLAGYAQSDLVTARGPVKPGEESLPPVDDPGHKAAYFALWRKSRATGYCRAIERACRDLLGLEYVEENADAISDAITKLKGADPAAAYVDVMQQKAGIAWGIKDSIRMPDDTRDELYPAFVRFNYRDDPLLYVGTRHEVTIREAAWGRSIHSLDDLIDGFMQSISDCLATGKVTSLKIGVAYRRALDFKEATRHEAELGFNRLMSIDPGSTTHLASATQSIRSAEELRPLHDYLTHVFVRRAADEDLPIQVHTGYLAGNRRVLTNVNPMQLLPLLIRYPAVRFDLFHAGWPFHHEMGTIGKHYPNVWINLCWAWTMNPVTMEHALDAWLDGVPHCKIFGFGSDTGNPICAYGYAVQAREGIARVLERRIARGDTDLPLAREVARAIMLENGVEFHDLG